MNVTFFNRTANVEDKVPRVTVTEIATASVGSVGALVVLYAIFYCLRRRKYARGYGFESVSDEFMDPVDAYKCSYFLSDEFVTKMSNVDNYEFRVPEGCTTISSENETNVDKLQIVRFRREMREKAVAIANMPIPIQKKAVFECKILFHSEGEISIGFSCATKDLKFYRNLPGLYPGSIGYFSSGYIHQDSPFCHAKSVPYVKNDIIAGECNRRDGCVVIYKNGIEVVRCPWACGLVRDWTDDLALFPCIGCDGNARIEVNFGSRRFENVYCKKAEEVRFGFSQLDDIIKKAQEELKLLKESDIRVEIEDEEKDKISRKRGRRKARMEENLGPNARFEFFQRRIKEGNESRRKIFESNLKGEDIDLMMLKKNRVPPSFWDTARDVPPSGVLPVPVPRQSSPGEEAHCQFKRDSVRCRCKTFLINPNSIGNSCVYCNHAETYHKWKDLDRSTSVDVFNLLDNRRNPWRTISYDGEAYRYNIKTKEIVPHDNPRAYRSDEEVIRKKQSVKREHRTSEKIGEAGIPMVDHSIPSVRPSTAAPEVGRSRPVSKSRSKSPKQRPATAPPLDRAASSKYIPRYKRLIRPHTGHGPSRIVARVESKPRPASAWSGLNRQMKDLQLVSSAYP